jgi:ribosomal-protein-alanine N-acetyltransferase
MKGKRGAKFQDCEMRGKVPWRIREFRSSDIEQIMEIEAMAFPKSAFSKEILLMYALRLPLSFLVLETEDGVEGYIIYDLDGHIYSMAVRSSCRRRGFGRALFMQALEHVKDSLWLEVRSKNLTAIEFYRKMGMRVTGKVAGYYGTDDAHIMVLDKKGPNQSF